MDPFELFGGSGSGSHLGDLSLPTPNDGSMAQPHMQQLLSSHPSLFTPSGAPGALSESDTNLLTALFAPFQADRNNAAMMVNQHQPQQNTDFMQQNQAQHDASQNQFGIPQFSAALQTPGVHAQQSMNPNALFADLYASPYGRNSSSITNAGGAGLQPDGLPPAISADGMFQQFTNLQRGSSGLSGLSIPASNPGARPPQNQQAVNFSAAAAQASGPSSSKAAASSGPAPMVTSSAPAAPAARSNKKGTAVKETASKGKAANASNKKIKTGPMSEEEMKERRKKHNEVEIRRRQRIKNSFSELGAIIGCDSSQKRIILSSAIDAIKDYEDKIKSLQTSIDNLSVPDDTETKAVAAPAPTDVAAVDPNSTAVDHGSIFHSSGVPLAIASFDGRVLDCNPAFARLFGFTREAMVEGQSTTLFSLTAPESLPAAFTTVGSLMGGQPSVQNNIQIIGPEGVMRSVRLTAWSVRENQKPKYFMCMVIPLSTDGAVLPPNASAQLANEPKHLIMDQPFNRPAT